MLNLLEKATTGRFYDETRLGRVGRVPAGTGSLSMFWGGRNGNGTVGFQRFQQLPRPFLDVFPFVEGIVRRTHGSSALWFIQQNLGRTIGSYRCMLGPALFALSLVHPALAHLPGFLHLARLFRVASLPRPLTKAERKAPKVLRSFPAIAAVEGRSGFACRWSC